MMLAMWLSKCLASIQIACLVKLLSLAAQGSPSVCATGEMAKLMCFIPSPVATDDALL